LPFFFGQKDSMQRIFIKKCFLFTVGRVSHKAVCNRSRNSVVDIQKLLMLNWRCGSGRDNS
jgi:hypothetical protein